jgi:hypothetical protein
MLERLTEDALLLVVSFLAVPDLLRLTRTCRQLRHTLGNPDGSAITNAFSRQWGPNFSVWQPLFAVANTSVRFQTAAVCEKLAALCGCWTLVNIEGFERAVRGGICSILPTVDGLRVCLVAPKRVCLDDFEWQHSDPLQDIGRAVAFLGRLDLVAAIECTYLADRVLPAFDMDVQLLSAWDGKTVRARLVGREYTAIGDICAGSGKCVSCAELLHELAASFDPCLPHHDVFYPPHAPDIARRSDEHGAAPDSASHHAAHVLASYRMKDTSRHCLSRSDFHELSGQCASDQPSASHARCIMCSQSLPSGGVQCSPSNCTCSRSNRPLGLKVRFANDATCCLGFVCCTATLPRFDSGDLLPLFKSAYPITAPWTTTPLPSPQPMLLPSASCLCSVQGLWAGDYGPHGIEIICVLQVKPHQLFDILSTQSHFSHAQTQARDRKFAVKLTGDPNIPAGQVTFVIPNQPLLSRPVHLPCGCSSELRRGIFAAQDIDEPPCNCPPATVRANCVCGMQLFYGICMFT